MNTIQLFDPESSTYTYILFDVASRAAVVIDPVDSQLERDLDVMRQHELRVMFTVETHAHADHITSAGLLAEHTGAKTVAPAGCSIDTASWQLKDGEVLEFGAQQLKAMHTPGHTAGSMCFFWDSQQGPQVFTGDTLLINGCGRTDFQSGSAQDMYSSLTDILFKLPESTTVWPGHDYKGQTKSTIGHEKRHNARIAGKSLEEFVALMDGLNLPRPKRIDEPVPANRTSGLRHDAHDGQPRLDAPDLAPRPATGYAGDVSPALAWAWVEAGSAVLVDVRSDAEREWVGFVPGAKPVAWKQWPGMAMNPSFDQGILDAASPGQRVVLLCRSGVRSIAAAKRATELGLQAYNILEGFEGDPDTHAHRGRRGGWRLHGLPWRQN
jgi:sulfur dioxygenase